MDDESPVIYGLEFQSRCLVSLSAESDSITFFVGTQSQRKNNQVHMLTFDDDTNSLNKTIYNHPYGEIWHLSACPWDGNVIGTCSSKVIDNHINYRVVLWSLSEADDPLTDDTSAHSLRQLVEFDSDSESSNATNLLFNPSGDTYQVAVVLQNAVGVYDLNNVCSSASKSSPQTIEAPKNSRFTNAKWNPHHSCNLIATASANKIQAWDIRTLGQAFCIDNAHSPVVRDLDFNPNKQYCLATCGDDGFVKFWDTRNATRPLHTLSDHSHWVWSVRYNPFHDQLVLTSSSDSRVVLNNLMSISSEPYGHQIDDGSDEASDTEDLGRRQADPLPDGVICTIEEHEDSVYAAEFSNTDPWVFASVSYDGRVVINKVPRNVKYNILL